MNKKILFIVYVSLICITLILPMMSAEMEFDNVKTYNPNTNTAVITDNFGLGGVLAEITLTSPHNVNVIYGEDRLVAEFTIKNYGDYDNVFNDLDFINLKNGKTMTKNFQYKYKNYITHSVDDYAEICKLNDLGNGTSLKYDCYLKEVGKHNETYFEWKPLNDKAILPEGDWEIGLFVDVMPNEKGEWIPTFYGKSIPEWAEWTESLNTNIISYYDFEDGSGTTVTDSLGSYDMTSNSSTWVTGKVGTYAMNFSRSAKEYARTTSNVTGTAGTNWTINGWFKLQTTSYGTDPATVIYEGATYTADDESRAELWINYDAGANKYTIASPNSPGPTQVGSVVYDAWTMLTLRYDVSQLNLTAWKNGVLLGSRIQDGETLIDGEFKIGKNSYGEFYTNMVADEIGLWNRELSEAELIQLYNGGTGLTYVGVFNDPPVVTLNTPIEAENFTTQNVIFNATISDDMAQITNASLILNGVINQTNASVTNNTQVTFTVVLPDGDYNWTYEAYDNFTERTTPSIRNLTVDTTVPDLNLTSPLGNISLHTVNTNLAINWTALDENLDTCKLEVGLTNTTVTCNDNGTFINITSSNFNNATLWANDTLGNTNAVSLAWDYLVFFYSETSNAFTIEGGTEAFSSNVDTLTALASASLYYNNTFQGGTTTNTGGSNYHTNKSISIPAVSTATNKTYYWSYTLSSGENINSTSKQQQIQDLTLDNCGVNTVLLYNFTLLDEEGQTWINQTTKNASIQIDLDISAIGTTTPIIEFSDDYAQVNPAQVCLSANLSSTEFRLDGLVRYDADGWAAEFYNIQNFTLKQSVIPQNIDLYDLNDSDTTEFLITFKGTDFLPEPEAIIDITKNYIEEGAFKTVEVLKTDSDGQAIGHFDRNSVIYTIIVKKDGTILGTFPNVAVVCEDEVIGDCKITLNALSTSDAFPDWQTNSGLSYSISFDKTTRVVTVPFTVLDGGTATVLVNTTLFDNYGNTSVCSQSLTGSSGTLTCNIPIGYQNQTVVTKLYNDGEFIAQRIFSIFPDANDTFGGSQGIFVLILFLTIPFMFIGEKMGLIIGGIFGFIVAGGIFLMDTGSFIGPASIIFWTILSGGILAYKLSRRSSV